MTVPSSILGRCWKYKINDFESEKQMSEFDTSQVDALAAAEEKPVKISSKEILSGESGDSECSGGRK